MADNTNTSLPTPGEGTEGEPVQAHDYSLKTIEILHIRSGDVEYQDMTGWIIEDNYTGAGGDIYETFQEALGIADELASDLILQQVPFTLTVNYTPGGVVF